MRGGRFPAEKEGGFPMLMNKIKAAGAVVTTLALSTAAHAQSSEYAGLTSAVNFDDAKTAMLTIGGVVALVLVVRRGIKFVHRMI